MAFNAKNLTYELKEPEFLRKLKQQHGSGDGGRQVRPSARPKRLRTDDDDDEPTYVDGDTNEILTQHEYDTMMGKSLTGPGPSSVKHAGGDDEPAHAMDSEQTPAPQSLSIGVKENMTEVGERRKKRAAKVIADEDEGSHAEMKVDVNPSKSELQTTNKERKKKKIKLSFADEANAET